MSYLSEENITNLLAKSDLSTIENHCIAIAVLELKQFLFQHFNLQSEIVRGNRIVSVADNYYELGYSPNEITLNTRYTNDIGYSKPAARI